LAGCGPPPPPPPPIHYVLEPAWRAGDTWFYPHETLSLDATGIAAILPQDHPSLTTDNEPYDPNAMAAAMQAVQLPAIATLTNLDNGRQLAVRINDRGPANPARLIAVTPRVAALLAFTDTARMRVQFDPERCAALRRQVQGHAGDIAIDAAPRGDVQQADLAPLAGTAQETARSAAAGPTVAQAEDAPTVTVPLRLPEQLIQGEPDPGALIIHAGTFTHESAARHQLAAISDPSARLIRSRSGGQTGYDVQAGPYADIAEADAALARMLEDGVTDARIAIDLQ
jgi:rare lipoprotein A